MMARQSLTGGDASTNIQADTMITYVGIDEKRAREICQEMYLQLKKEYTQEALEVANSRVSEFENRLVAKMDGIDGALRAFADPSFQILLANAQKAAACTERETDYELLSELLVHRFQKGANRVVRAGINLAVEVVDKISDEALLGLTIAHAIVSFRPLVGGIGKGLDVLNELFGKIRYAGLPQDAEWIDHLDILSAVRINSFGSLKKLDSLYSEILGGYCAPGIEVGTESYNKATRLLKDNNLPENLLVKHELISNHVRINVSNKMDIDQIQLQMITVQSGTPVAISTRLTDAKINVLKSLYDLYSTDGNSVNATLEAFRQELDKRENLKIVRAWWDNIPVSFNITSAGKVLAHANAQRCDSSLPPLN